MKSQHTILGKYSSFFLISINVATIAIIHVSLIGYTLCITSSLLGSTFITMICCVILYFIVSVIMKIAVSYDVSTMDIISGYFGKKGIILCAMIIGGSFFGWFIWQLDFCAKFFKYLSIFHIPFLCKISQEQVVLMMGILFTGTALLGEWGLRLISLILVPLLSLSVIGVIVFFPINLCFSKFSFEIGPLSLSTLSLLLSGLAAHALSTPTFYKFSMSVDSAQKSIKVVYLIVLPIICGIGILLGVLSPTQDIFALLEQSKGIWPFAVMAYVLFGTWTVCSLNLHYGADAIAYIFSLRDHTPIVAIASVISLILICFDSQLGMGTSETLGTLVVGILTVVIARASMSNLVLSRDNPQTQEGNYKALLISCCIGIMTRFDLIEMTGVPFFDTSVVAFFLCIYFSRFHRRKTFIRQV